MPIFNRLIFNKYLHAEPLCYGVLVRISSGYSPVKGRLHTCYSPIRRSPPSYCYSCAAPRLACVRPIASVHPEPGSNSSLYICICLELYRSPFFCLKTAENKYKTNTRTSNPVILKPAPDSRIYLFPLCSLIERVPI